MTGVDTPPSARSPSAQHPSPRSAFTRRSAARVLAALTLLAPFIALPFAVRLAVECVAQRAGTALADATEAMSKEADHFEDPSTPLTIGDPVTVLLPHPSLFSPDSQPLAHSARRTSTKSAPRGGIRVRADVVARAAASGMRPTGVPVPASGMRPAGIALQGVSAFGAGLRDGDVVTSVAGAPARSVGAVVGAVMGALRAKAKVITGVVWRGNQQLTVTVEIPWGKVQPRSKRD